MKISRDLFEKSLRITDDGVNRLKEGLTALSSLKNLTLNLSK